LRWVRWHCQGIEAAMPRLIGRIRDARFRLVDHGDGAEAAGFA